ncbi:MAG: hypothetical protein EHM45_17390 [Desulfobacteraceae bacterium]|nr:MAG: hypothetical protein EHM45_17390 [Desulfobacteraceae bacterium]
MQMQEKKHEPLMSLRELQDYLPGHPHRSTVWRWIKKGLPVYRMFNGRLGFRKAEVDKLLRVSKNNVAQPQDNGIVEYVKR